MQDDDQEIANLPLTERLHHKIWKVRLQAYEEISKQFLAATSPSDECFRIFLSDPTSLQKAVCDSNVAAQEAAITALLTFLEEGGPNACIRTRSAVVGPMAEKSLASTRAGTKRKATDALLMYIELDIPDPIIDDLIPLLSHKLPKLVAATGTALTEIYKTFGAKTIPPKPATTALPKLFGHADKNVRAAAKSLSVELYKWLGDGLKAVLFPNLKPVQQKELEEAFEQVKGEVPHQERYLRSQQAAQNSQDSNIESNTDQTDVQVDQVDGYDLLEPVDVIKKLPADLETRMASSKWKDRKECLDEILIAVNTPRIKDGDFNDLIRALAKSMKDANVGVVTVAAQCTECLARGLRSDFVRHIPSILPPTLERLKEKKQSVAEALGKSLDAMFFASSLSDVLEDTLTASKHKTPQVRLESTKFLARCLTETKVYPQKQEIKVIAEATVKLFGDTLEVNRTAAFEATGTLMKIVGEKQMSIYLEGVDDIKKQKLKDFYDKATVKAKAPKPAAPQSVPTSAPNSRSQGPVKRILKAKRPQGTTALANSSSNSINTIRPTPASSIPPVTPKRAISSLTHTPPSISSPAMAKRNTTSRISQPKIGASHLSSSIKPANISTNLPPRKTAAVQGGAPSSGLPSLASPRPARIRSTAQAGENTQMSGQRLAVGSGIGLGLTRRPLAASVSQVPANATTVQPAKLDTGLSLAEKQELESLRAEKEELEKARAEWRQQTQDYQSEISKLTQELSALQVRNAELLEEHTRDVLALKGKDSQVLRLKSDLDNEKARVSKLEAERHRLNAMLENSLVSYNQITETRPYSAPVKDELGMANADQSDIYSLNRNGRRYDEAPSAGEAGNWQRAGEVTTLLKDRIAALKAGRLKTANSAR